MYTNSSAYFKYFYFMAKDFNNHAGNEFYEMFNTLTSNVAFKLIMNFAYRTFCPTGSTSTISQSTEAEIENISVHCGRTPFAFK